MGRPDRVLLVARPDVTSTMAAVLDLPDVEHLTATSTTEALEYLETHRIDCLVSDYEVPDRRGIVFLGGLELLEQVRDRGHEIPFVLYTNVSNDEIAAQAISNGATDYISRTGSRHEGAELRESVRRILRRRRAERRVAQQSRINDLVREVNRALVRATDRSTVEESICALLTDGETYSSASVLVVADGGSVSVAAQAGSITNDDVRSSSILEVVREAKTTGTLHVRRMPALDGTVATIPIAHEVVYGVLVLVASDANVFDETERTVLADLGSTIGHAIAAVETQRESDRRKVELERQNERLESFAGIVSHDLRNPLAVAQGHLELYDELDEDEALEIVSESLDRMERLIDELLTLARHGQAIGDTEPLSIAAAARQAWEECDGSASTLEIECDSDVSLEADRLRLEELFGNLFRNALEYAGADVTVTVECDQHGFAVVDDGPGIPSDAQADVFERGFSTSAAGTGLGLAIVAEIAEGHGWQVSVTDADDGGARFVVETAAEPPASHD